MVIASAETADLFKELLNTITVFKLLKALSKSSERSSDYLNLASESVPATATCSLVLLAILFFMERFPTRSLLFCCCFLSVYTCTSSLMDRAEWLHGTSCLGQPSWLSEPAQQNDPASFQLTSCNSEAISAELTTDC